MAFERRERQTIRIRIKICEGRGVGGGGGGPYSNIGEQVKEYLLVFNETLPAAGLLFVW